MGKLINSIFDPFLIVLSTVSLTPVVYSESLYNLDDPLWELDASNFERVIFGKSNAWVVEFYSAWCGHCIRFAPTWKQFARDIENWKNVIEVAVINCADSDNTKLCRTYGVIGYPTIKFFWTNIKEGDHGTKYEGSRTIPDIRHGVIDFLQAHENETLPFQWPHLSQLSRSAHDINSFWKRIPSSVNPAYVVIEDPFQYLGRSVILDLTINRQVTMRRVLTINTALVEALDPGHANDTFTLLKLNRDGAKEVIYRSVSSANHSKSRDDIFETLMGRKRVKEPNTDKPDDITDEPLTSYDGVYMADIENAVRYALRQEVGVQEQIDGEKLTALKSFLLTLKKFFPGRPNVKSYLEKLSDWVARRKGNLTGTQFVNKMDEFQTDKDYLPEMQDWVGCKGSSAKYRGYPCSLWTLFHTLTVEAFAVYEKNPMIIKDAPQKILFDIKGYVKNFFTCEGCARHFQEMSANLEKETKHPKDTVLWLWQAHNIVNKRLAGDETEDPKHKKIQFPSVEACSRCQINSSNSTSKNEWDRAGVLRYVRHFYAKERIKRLNEKGEMTSVRDLVLRDPNQERATSAGNIEDNPLTSGRHLPTQFLFQVLNVLPLIRNIGQI